MIEWFVIAMIYFKDTDVIEVKKMERPFSSEATCKEFIASSPGISKDIILLEPFAIGASFKCFDANDVKKFEIQRRSI